MANAIVIFLAFFLFLGKGAVGELICEDLPIGMCSYSIDSFRNRCVLETFEAEEGITMLQCKKSEVKVNGMKEHIESDECIRACGLDRFSVGISTDSLADSRSVTSICSTDCYQNCPNILDLYDNLALAEGAPLNARCKDNEIRSRVLASAAATRRRAMQLLKASVASGPSGVANAPFAGAESPFSSTDCPPPAASPGQF